jgi:hypothetical protein
LDAIVLVEIIKSLPQNAAEVIYLKAAFGNDLKTVWDEKRGLSVLDLVASFLF